MDDFNTSLDRRSVLKGLLAAGGFAVTPGLLAACGSSADSSGGGSASKVVTVTSRFPSAPSRDAYQAQFDEFTRQTGINVKVNLTDNTAFNQQINTYLTGKPDDLFTWSAGYRMRFFADRGLVSPMDDVWEKIGSKYTAAAQQASTGTDGHKYIVPVYYYPEAFFYRKSVWQQRGYVVPKTMDEFIALLKKMKADGLEPIALANKEGWPAMANWDILNMRMNGYDFHINLLAGKESWTDPKVRQVYQTWRDLLPYHQSNANGRTWQEAAQAVQNKKAGMYFIGLYVGQVFGADADDLDMFPFPEVNPEFGQDAIEAPIDGFMLSKNPKDEKNAKALLEFLGGAPAQEIYYKKDPSFIATNQTVDTSGYTRLQQKAVQLLASVKHLAMYQDRDTRADFSDTVLFPAMQQFLNKPDDIDQLTANIEKQKKIIFAS